ncbi:DUF2231 domain-containing protein [Chloroflexi bacterium TSY]|nr:DUF2231 domain-containing protein [Chloroflexi bacterium TSY]
MNFLTTLHPATVHFPIALLFFASIAGILYLYNRPRNEFRILIWWTMLPGWIGCIVAIFTGLLAQAPLSPQAPYRHLLNWHIGTGIALAIVYGALLYWRWIRRAQTRVGHDPLLDDSNNRRWITLLLLMGLFLLLASGWNGGRLVYEWGVNVMR